MHSLSSSLSSASSSSFSTHSSSFSQEALSDGDPCKMDGSRPVLPRKKADGNMYPRRGAIKAKIFRAVVKCIIALASDLGKGRRRKKGFSSNKAPVTASRPSKEVSNQPEQDPGSRKKAHGNQNPKKGKIKAKIIHGILHTPVSSS